MKIEFGGQNLINNTRKTITTIVSSGGIDESTKAWKEPATVSEENLATNPLVYTMSFEQRAMDLDQLSAPEGYVLTGLKLRKFIK